jgi:hypothetical protein
MVKSGFLKTIKKNMSFKKSFMILGLLIVLTIVLFSCVNNYSIENLTPKPNIEVEIFLWVDSYGSVQNDLALRWVEFINQHGNIPNITLGRAPATEFTKYLELDKFPELNIDTNKSLEVLKSIDLTKDNKLLPFVSIFFVGTKEGKAYKSPLGIFTGKDVTYDIISKTIHNVTSVRWFSDALYESDVNVAPVAPVAPVMEKLPVSETSTQKSATPTSIFNLSGIK